MDYQRTWCQLLLGPSKKTDMRNQWVFWWAGRVVTCLKSLHTNIYICDDMRVSLFGWVYPQHAHIIPIIDPVTNYWDPTKGDHQPLPFSERRPLYLFGIPHAWWLQWNLPQTKINAPLREIYHKACLIKKSGQISIILSCIKGIFGGYPD